MLGCRHCPAKLRIATLTIRRLFQGLPAPNGLAPPPSFTLHYLSAPPSPAHIYTNSAFQPSSRKLLNSLLMLPMPVRKRVRRSAPRNNVVIGRENIIPRWLCSLQRAATVSNEKKERKKKNPKKTKKKNKNVGRSVRRLNVVALKLVPREKIIGVSISRTAGGGEEKSLRRIV